MPWLERVTLDPDIRHGEPGVRHLRWPVAAMFGLVSSGMSMDEVLADHAELEREDIQAYLNVGRLPISFTASRREMMLTDRTRL